MDFTHGTYQDLLDALLREGYQFLLFRDLAETPEAGTNQPCVLLRHDVDRLPERSLSLARLEHEAGISSTYFFRTKPVSFSSTVMAQIKDMGHEIGFHYESLSDAKGEMELAWKYFRRDLEKFRPFGRIVTIAMHGRPLSPWDNRKLWEHFNYRDVGIWREAYLDVDWNRFLYFTDTGRCWNGKNNIRDHVSAPATQNIVSTKDLIDFVGHRKDMIISTHPERWTNTMTGWLQVMLTDSAINMVKQTLKFMLSLRPRPV